MLLRPNKLRKIGVNDLLFEKLSEMKMFFTVAEKEYIKVVTVKAWRNPEKFPDLEMASDSSDTESFDSDSDYCAGRDVDSDGDSNACSKGVQKDDVPLPAPEHLVVDDC